MTIILALFLTLLLAMPVARHAEDLRKPVSAESPLGLHVEAYCVVTLGSKLFYGMRHAEIAGACCLLGLAQQGTTGALISVPLEADPGQTRAW